MKHILLVTLFLISACSFAQPQGINYQGIARDAGGNALPNQNISLRLSILDSSVSGLAVYANIPWGQGGSDIV